MRYEIFNRPDVAGAVQSIMINELGPDLPKVFYTTSQRFNHGVSVSLVELAEGGFATNVSAQVLGKPKSDHVIVQEREADWPVAEDSLSTRDRGGQGQGSRLGQ